ncbi:MAG: hypothetical protein AB1540_11195 [Bdellovibrionota bacterium]
MTEAATLSQKLRAGVEEMLRANARVLYETLFSIRHIGRVIDFCLYESKSFLDAAQQPLEFECRIRQILEIAIFNGWTNSREGDSAKCVEIEFGWDDIRLIISVSHFVAPDVQGFVPGNGLPSNEAASRMAGMFEKIQALSDGLVIRHEQTTGRVQLVAFVSAQANAKGSGIEYVNVDSVEDIVQPNLRTEVAIPSPLSTGKVREFLQDEREDEKKSKTSGLRGAAREDASTAGLSNWKVKRLDQPKQDAEPEFKSLEKKSDPKEALTSERTEAEPSLAETPEKNKEDDQFLTSLMKKAGEGEDLASDSEQKGKASGKDWGRISEKSGGAADRVIDDRIVVSGGGPQDLTDEELNVKDLKEKYSEDLQQVLRAKDAQMALKSKHYQDQIDHLNSKVEALKAEKQTLVNRQASGSSLSSSSSEFIDGQEKAESKEHVLADFEELDVKFQKLVERYQSEIEKGVVPESARAWAKGFMEDMLKDRAALNDRARAVATHLKKKEFDFKTQETALREEIRLKDEQLRQKELSLSKTKETLTNTLKSLEETKRLASAGNLDKNEFNQKLASTERNLEVSKEAHQKLIVRFEELQKKWQEDSSARILLQQELSKQKPLTEELKRQNKELQMKLMQVSSGSNQQKSGGAAHDLNRRSGSGAESEAEVRHKLDQANKLSKAMKDELERTRKRFDELKLEETNLRIELVRVQGQLKAATKGQPQQPQKPQTQRGSTPLHNAGATGPTLGQQSVAKKPKS